MIAFRCNHCDRSLKVKDDLAGKKVKCPQCSQVVAVPMAEAARVTPAAPADAEAPTLAPALPESGRQETQSDGATDGGSGPVPAELTDFLAPPQAADEIGRLGPYRVLKVLGAGGMGAVFQAEDPQLRRHVALKVMLPALAASATARQRFLREAQAAAAIEHDHIVPIYQVGEDRGVPFLAMPLLKGESLDERLQREGTVPIAEVLRIGRETAEGLAAAHERGLMHRDIKPANLWLEGARGRVKILDFGLARSGNEPGQQLTQTGAILGTPAYMAPEQAKGKPVDGRCDLFSLGCVLYRLSTGALPFQGDDTISTLLAVATEEPPPPHTRNPAVPRGLSELVMHLLAKTPEGRPASARAVGAALQALDESASMTTQTGAGKPGPAAGRRWITAAVVVGILALAALLAQQLVVRVRDKEGKVVRETKLAAGHQVEVIVPPVPAAPPGTPLSAWALVSQPAPLAGVRSWTLDTAAHRDAISAQAFSADEELLATGGHDGTVRLWHVGSGRLRRVLVYHLGHVNALGWSPDGKTIASGGWDRTVRVWDVESGKLRETLEGHERAVHTLAWSADGKVLASGSDDRTVRLWQPGSGKPARVLEGHPETVIALAWRPGDKVLVATCGDRAVQLWQADTARPLARHQAGAHGSWSADHPWLASAVGRNQIEVWDADADRVVRTLTLQEQQADVSALALSPDGKVLATGAGKAVAFWDADSGKHLGTSEDGFNQHVHFLAWSPDSKTCAATGLNDGWVQLYRPGVPGAVRPRLQRPINLEQIAWSSRGRLLYARNGTVLGLWDASTGRTLPIRPAHWLGQGTADWTPEGQRVATRSSPYRSAQLWADEPARLLRQLGDHESLDARFVVAALAADGSVLALNVRDAGKFAICLWDTRTGKQRQALAGHVNWASAVVWSPDGQRLASQGIEQDYALRVWEVGTGKQLFRLEGEWILRGAAAWSPDGQKLLTGGDALLIWDGTTGQALQTVQARASGTGITAVAWSGGGERLASGDDKGTIVVWDAVSGKSLRRWQAHQGAVQALAWLTDGKTLASFGAGDFTARYWQTDRDEALRSGTAYTHRGRFSADGRWLLAQDDSTGTRVWDLSGGRVHATLLCLPTEPATEVAISGTGHYRGSPGIREHLVYIVETEQGQETLSCTEFEQKYGWQNDPDRVTLTASR